jgi:hypothetical protein
MSKTFEGGRSMTSKMETVDAMCLYSICSGCVRPWQNIDYGCAAHQLTCGYPLPPKLPAKETR